MAATFRSSSSTTYASATSSKTVTAPAGIQDGDGLLLIAVLGETVVPTASPPAGFTIVTGFPTTATAGGFTVMTWAWTKVAASESGNYAVTWNSGNTVSGAELYIAAIAGVNPSVLQVPTATVNNGTGATTTATGVTISTPGTYVCFISQDWGDSATSRSAPTGTTPTFTRRLDLTGGILFAADGTLAGTGATGNKTITNNSTGSDPWVGSLICFAPSVQTVAFQSRFMRQAVNRASTY